MAGATFGAGTKRGGGEVVNVPNDVDYKIAWVSDSNGVEYAVGDKDIKKIISVDLPTSAIPIYIAITSTKRLITIYNAVAVMSVPSKDVEKDPN